MLTRTPANPGTPPASKFVKGVVVVLTVGIVWAVALIANAKGYGLIVLGLIALVVLGPSRLGLRRKRQNDGTDEANR